MEHPWESATDSPRQSEACFALGASGTVGRCADTFYIWRMSKQDHPDDVGKVRKFEHPGRGRDTGPAGTEGAAGRSSCQATIQAPAGRWTARAASA